MVATFAPGPLRPLHPLHSILLAFPVTLFLSALVSDIAYWRTFEIQWANFAAWLNAGGLLGGGFALLWAMVNLLRGRAHRNGRAVLYALVLLATWVVGFINALVHAKDAWATMPEGLYLSVAATALALAAAWIGYSGLRVREIG
ncbi:DUF2231 domain-containing protein [Rubellimicrobium roseum]|uniref:DUF2231 domain-containing protein n=1 Tax=Rubellimicrobium roseum TaxID=687525 RepID=A0A5C4NG98_9RHOB|nr:DUF2231 domain-containing protein [Rubellimicrobium roseum]TNC73683.1 hypothetical protein FHG71_04145 [Rubellimicrobium roseum]